MWRLIKGDTNVDDLITFKLRILCWKQIISHHIGMQQHFLFCGKWAIVTLQKCFNAFIVSNSSKVIYNTKGNFHLFCKKLIGIIFTSTCLFEKFLVILFKSIYFHTHFSLFLRNALKRIHIERPDFYVFIDRLPILYINAIVLK